jgi:hypothetical protein
MGWGVWEVWANGYFMGCKREKSDIESAPPKNVPNRWRAIQHLESQTFTGQLLDPMLTLKNIEVPLANQLTQRSQ